MSNEKREEISSVMWQRATSALGGLMVDSIVSALLAKDEGYNALDLACGDGLLTKEISKRFERVVAVDASHHHIKAAMGRVPSAEFHTVLIEEYNPKGELFDRIYMISVLEHLDDPVGVVARVGEWLSEDGVLVACVPNAHSLNRRIGQRMGIIGDHYELMQQDIDVGHKRLYSRESLVSTMESGGLTLLSSGGVLLKPFTSTQMEWFMDGWSKVDSDPDWGDKLCGALRELGAELPDLANSIWVRCGKQGRNG